MRKLLVALVSLPLLTQTAVSQKLEQAQALDFARTLHGNNTAAILPTYRGLLEVVGTARGLEAQTIPGTARTNTTYIVNGTPTVVEQDTRTQNNFFSASRQSDRIWLGVSTTDATNKDLFPDAVAVKTDRGGLCSGTLVSADVVVTAAHCFCEGNTPEWVVFGLSTDMSLPQVKLVGVDKPKSKPKMQCGAYADGDIAVVKLSQSVTVPFRKIAPSALVSSAASVRIVGFGKTERGTSGAKLMVDVPVTSHTCQGSSARGADASVFGCTPDFELVASSPLTNQDSCNGDSGGGVFVQAANGEYLLAGVVSRGITTPNVRPCGDGGIYPRIDGPRMRQWLAETVPSVLP